MENNGKKWKTMEENGKKWKKWKTMARDRRPGMPLIFVYILGSGSP